MVGCGLVHVPARGFLQLISMLGMLIALQNHETHLTQFSYQVIEAYQVTLPISTVQTEAHDYIQQPSRIQVE